jgi:ABC-type sugar transport system substrate-binding protein
MNRTAPFTIITALLVAWIAVGCAGPAAPTVSATQTQAVTLSPTFTAEPAEPTATVLPTEPAATAAPAENSGGDAAVSAGQDARPTVNPQSLVIGYTGDNNSMSEQKLADLEQACQELQIQCVKGDDILELVEQNVSALIIFSNRWHVLGAWPQLHEAASKGIPMIVLGAETGETGAYNLSVETYSVRTGLEWILKQTGEKGKLVYINYGHSDFHQAIIDDVLKQHPEVKATAFPADYENNRLSEDKIAALLKQNPNLSGIWSDDDENTIFWGVKEEQSKRPLAIVCPAREDFLQFWKERIDSDSPFQCITFIKPGGVAYEGVYFAYYLLSGGKVNPAALGGDSGNTLLYDFPVITNENLDEWLAKVDTFRVGQWDTLELAPMTPEEIKAAWFEE